MPDRLIPDDEVRTTRWFAPACCVVELNGVCEVLAGGSLIGRYGPGQQGIRNALLLGLSEDKHMHLGHLADAFGISAETLRLLRKVMREQGFEAAVQRRYQGGALTVLTPRVRRRIESLFAEGKRPLEVFRVLKKKVGLRSIERVRSDYLAQGAKPAGAGEATEPAPVETPAQLSLKSTEPELADGRVDPCEPVRGERDMSSPAPAVSETAITESSSSDVAIAQDRAAESAAGTPAMYEKNDDHRANATTRVQSAAHVQHIGAWVMVVLLAREGLFERAHRAGKERVKATALRIALEALVIALCVGESCVEGVRRLQTASAGVLLRAQWAPSASWVRRVLGLLSQEMGGFFLHMAMAVGYVRALRATSDEAVVFYVDNHLRPYSGSAVIRRGWRMQAKRAVPGITDYYVHDEDGRPLFRFDVPEHEGLTQWLPRITGTLRGILDAGEKIILAFDRAGAFPESMASLRDERVSFVTYERRPYPQLLPSAFTQELTMDGVTIQYADLRTNLGKGRGRLRRIALRVPDDRAGHRQVNLLAAGDEPAERFIQIIAGRWNQENGFKHGVERWGINQLDGRATRPYPQDAIIPNPARRRLDRAIRAARAHEGKLRCALAQGDLGSPDRSGIEQELSNVVEEIREFEAQRPSIPPSASLKDTELAGALRRHSGEYKVTIDAVRIACANIEAELALRLAPHMKYPDEAKKLLANLFAASGRLHARADRIIVRLDPAGTVAERTALATLLAEVNSWNPHLPGHPEAPPVQFEVQL